MIKKVLLGILGALAVLAYLGWRGAVAVHDRDNPNNTGSLSTLLDLLSSRLDTGKQAKTAYDKGDFETARKLYQKRAEHGNSDAMLRLGVMYSKGQGGSVDDVQAVKWFRGIADKGDSQGQFAMGLAYDNGTGVAQDYSEARNWYLKAARTSTGARVNLGVLYLDGHGLAVDRIEAQKWFILGGDTGKPNRAVLDGRLTADENAQAKQRADHWKPGT